MVEVLVPYITRNITVNEKTINKTKSERRSNETVDGGTRKIQMVEI